MVRRHTLPLPVTGSWWTSPTSRVCKLSLRMGWGPETLRSSHSVHFHHCWESHPENSPTISSTKSWRTKTSQVCKSLLSFKTPRMLKSIFESSVQFSRSVVSDSLWPRGLQHARPPCPSPTPGVYSNSCPSSRWCHPTISSSVVPFSSHLQSFPASGSFQNESGLWILDCIKKFLGTDCSN